MHSIDETEKDNGETSYGRIDRGSTILTLQDGYLSALNCRLRGLNTIRLVVGLRSPTHEAQVVDLVLVGRDVVEAFRLSDDIEFTFLLPAGCDTSVEPS
jgi:hypothetical protein